MKIANPIYDAVFKFFLMDQVVAKLVISRLLNVEVLEVDFSANETAAKVKSAVVEGPHAPVISVLRLDFSAKIRTVDGCEKRVMIELQKCQLRTDLGRFRKYLAQAYMMQENRGENELTSPILPVIPVYILGHTLEDAPALPAVAVKRILMDPRNNQVIEAEMGAYLECLTHDAVFVQLPLLSEKR